MTIGMASHLLAFYGHYSDMELVSQTKNLVA